MAWFKKNPDLISDRAQALNDEIARLESQIKKLDGRLQRNGSHPRLRSTALPHGATVSRELASPASARQPGTGTDEPIFEEVDQARLKEQEDATVSADYSNDLDVRKYDLAALLRRFRDQFRGPSTTNPKLVSYLAAGGLQGLRPLRYEKRVARNRVIALALVLFVMLLGIYLVVRHR